MGMFTWRTSDTDKTLKASWVEGDLGRPTTNKATLVLPDNETIEGHYDGYGHLSGMDIFTVLGAYMEGHDINTVMRLYNCTNDSDKWRETFFKDTEKGYQMIKLVENYTGQKYDEITPSEDCESQGFMYVGDELEGEGEYYE